MSQPEPTPTADQAIVEAARLLRKAEEEAMRPDICVRLVDVADRWLTIAQLVHRPPVPLTAGPQQRDESPAERELREAGYA